MSREETVYWNIELDIVANIIYLGILYIITKTCLFKYDDIFLVLSRNRGGSNGYQQFMFWTEIRKIMFTPVNPSFTI